MFVADIIEEKEAAKKDFFADISSAVIEDPVSAFLTEFVEKNIASRIYWVNSMDNKGLFTLPEESTGLGNLLRINDIPGVDSFLKKMNRSLDTGEYAVICMETKNTRKERLLNRYPGVISYPFYVADFGVTRVLPKLSLTKKLYFTFTKGKNKVITLTEGLARLVCSGFKIIGYRNIDGLTYILAQKTGPPNSDPNPTYGAIVKLPRIGRNGEVIEVYKVRTMHPYSEHLQEYMFERFGTENGDKIENDFRKTRWGKTFRKYWIDEIPMIINLLKGDLKLVGVRPLSKHKYDIYPEYLQKKRIKTKPGLIPPFYAELPQTAEEFFETENRYIESYLKKPIRTDIRYFLKACYNIIFKGQRSR